ncbi:MAG: GTPase [Lachnospiraceae bacterium]|nr:GTPase [Lachnospiraceae bacterium]
MKPVYVINGFLDSGKTQFIAFTMEQRYFAIGGRTLLLLCEEGENEYGDMLLRTTRTVIHKIDDLSEFTPENMRELDRKYKPERILIEWNGMWDFRKLCLSDNWYIEQIVTNIDASTFKIYYSNMKSLLAEMVRRSELVIFNRCDGLPESDLNSFKRNVKAVALQSDIIFEDKNGEITSILEDDLPYDLNSPVLELDERGYGIWFIDMMDHADRYLGKTIEYVGQVMKPEGDKGGYMVPGRLAMTCCAADMSFLGYPCFTDKLSSFKERDWVKVKARVSLEHFKDYGDEEGPVLHAEDIVSAPKPAQELISFS